MVILIVFTLFADVHLTAWWPRLWSLTLTRTPNSSEMPRNYICGIMVLKPLLCGWLRLIPTPFLAFRGEPRNDTKFVISWKQYHGLDSGRRYASFISRQLPVACSTNGTILQATGSWARALEQGYRCAASNTSFTLLVEARHYFLCSCQLHTSAWLYAGSYLLPGTSGPVWSGLGFNEVPLKLPFWWCSCIITCTYIHSLSGNEFKDEGVQMAMEKMVHFRELE